MTAPPYFFSILDTDDISATTEAPFDFHFKGEQVWGTVILLLLKRLNQELASGISKALAIEIKMLLAFPQLKLLS
jgi:hypothetical protein